MSKKPKFYIKTLRLDLKVKSKLEDLARLKQTTVSELVRTYLHEALFGDPRPHQLFLQLSTKLDLLTYDLATAIKAQLVMSGQFSAEEAATWVSKNLRSVC